MHRMSVHRSGTELEAAITMPQLRVLHLVETADELRMTTLVESLGVGASTVSGLVDRLVDHGFVSRRDDPSDRRHLLVAVTPEGRDFLDRLRELGANHLRSLLERLLPDEIAVVGRSLDLLMRAAASEPDQADATDQKDPR